MSEYNQNCSNCGKNGHLFQQCKYPITSVGIIAFRKVNEVFEYLMIRRKDTIGYIEFIRGKYPLNNKLYIKNILSEMTNDEKEKVLSKEFDILWNEMWGDNPGIQYRGEEKAAKEKFDMLKLGINTCKELYNLQTLIDELDSNWLEPEWGFPKGRHNYQEKDLLCAFREFEEETGYNRTALSIIQNIFPFEEIFTGSNYKSYKHKYFLANIDKSCELSGTYNKSEVSKIEWKPLDDVIKSIRPYNLEKLDLITLVNKVLTSNKLYT
jgi:8-oxo-dGTP pyrophosphatase MutT (NUDIX family)